MMHVIIGGAASGKSEYAEKCALALDGEKVYLAAMKPYGEAAGRKISRHRKLRAGKGFETIEQYTEIGRVKDAVSGRTVLLECLSNLTANELFEAEGAGAENAADAIYDGIMTLMANCRHLVIVTLDVFEDGVSYAPETEMYRKVLAELNRRLAMAADRVTRVIYSVPVEIKGAQKKEHSCSR